MSLSSTQMAMMGYPTDIQSVSPFRQQSGIWHVRIAVLIGIYGPAVTIQAPDSLGPNVFNDVAPSRPPSPASKKDASTGGGNGKLYGHSLILQGSSIEDPV